MAIKHLQFDDSATIEFSSLTGTYQNLLSMSDDADVVFIYNTTNQAVLLKMPSGIVNKVLVYKDIRLPATATIAIDCRTNSKRIAKAIIQVKHAGSAPTSGEVTITVAR